MAVKFTVSERHNPVKPEEPRKWYATVHNSGEITLRGLCELVADRSAMTSAEVMAVLENFLTLIPRELSDGKLVRLGDFGTFFLTVHSEGTETEEKFTSDKITGHSLHFRPGQVLENQLAKTKFVKLEK